MGVYIWEEKLPSAYQEVEWIGSSRTQVINTGVIPTTQTYTAELEVESIKSGSEYWAFGIWGTTGFRGGQDSSGHWNTSYGASYEPSSYNLNTKTKITISNNGKGTSTDTAIGLFGMGESGDYPNNRKGAYKIYYCKILNNGTLIRDFVPCYRKSDDEIGMYDLVNNQFYTNSGSGTFTKGQDINYVEHELQNAYIGEYHEIICDFTQSDCGFGNYYWRNNNTHNPGRDSGGLYIQSSYGAGTANWKIPQSIYSKGTLKKIVIELYSQGNGNGGGIAIISSDSPCTRTRGNGSQLNGTIESNWSGSSSIGTQNPAGGYIFTIDLEKGEAYTDKSSNKLSISSHVTTIRSNFSSGNLALCVMKGNDNYTSYLRKATFYL